MAVSTMFNTAGTKNLRSALHPFLTRTCYLLQRPPPAFNTPPALRWKRIRGG